VNTASIITAKGNAEHSIPDGRGDRDTDGIGEIKNPKTLLILYDFYSIIVIHEREVFDMFSFFENSYVVIEGGVIYEDMQEKYPDNYMIVNNTHVANERLYGDIIAILTPGRI
jgi:hypothetical protein